MSMKRSDQIRMLEACLKLTNTGVWDPFFCYPNCASDLINAGLITEGNGHITKQGRAALFLLDKGPELEPDTSVITFSLPLKGTPDEDAKGE